jgi:tRNA-specific 2-thiouridylase
MKKDQTYALYTLTQEQLSQTLMPLGELESKEETRRIARETGISVANKPDSQEICFVPKEGYPAFLAKNAPETMRPGKIVDSGGRVRGEHDGVALYTIGQRKRLPASDSGPLYVVSLEPKTGTVVVGEDRELFATGFTASTLNWVAIPELTGEVEVQARIRYNGAAAPAVIRPGGEADSVECVFSEPQRAVTPGQSAVFYDGDRVLGGGIIEESL